MSRPSRFQKPEQKGPRTNKNIRAPEVRVIDESGEMRGVMSPEKAVELAEDVGLDLVEVSPNATPPVCKIMDYGKYKYEQQKKANAARKSQKTVDVKEVKVRPGIGEHDLQVKLRNARRFIESGDKVKVTMRFRGREMAHIELAKEIIERIKEELADIAKVELDAKMEGRQMVMILSPDN